MEYAVFKQQIMEQAKRILPQEEGYVITIVDWFCILDWNRRTSWLWQDWEGMYWKFVA